MKVLHTSDWHLGATDGDRSLYSDQEFFINQICEIAKREAVEVVIIAGDVYDRAITSADAIKLYDYAMTRLCLELKKQVLIVAGNHDSADRLSSCSSLLEKAGLHVVGKLEKEPTVINIGDVDFYMLPWFTEEKVKAFYPDMTENIQSLSDAYKLIGDVMRKNFRNGRKNIAVSHSFITNAEVSESDRAAQIGFATQVAASAFEGFDYVALGHIHKPQDIGDNIRYSGTPMPYSFGKEEKQLKSVTIIDTEDCSVANRKQIPVPLLHTRQTITGTLEEILYTEYPEDIRNGYVFIRVTDDFVGSEVNAKLKARFPNILQVSGMTYDDTNAAIRMTMDEFRELETNPVEIFKHFYTDSMGGEPDEHLIELFVESISGEDM